MLRRFVRWLLGIPHPDRLDDAVHMAWERERAKHGAVIEASRSNLAGGKGAGPAPRDWTQWH